MTNRLQQLGSSGPAQSLVSLMKEGLGLDSVPDVGSRFWVNLPLAASATRQNSAAGGTRRGCHEPATERGATTPISTEKGECDER